MGSITFDYMADKKEVTVSVRMTEELRDQIDQRAEHFKISRAAVLRNLLEEGMKAHIKLLPSASSLERQISTLNKKIDKIAETIHEYRPEGHKTSQETRKVD